MEHELYKQMNRNAPNDGGFSQMAAGIVQFANSYNGDPYAEAENMIRSGKITQKQWDDALNMARQIAPHLNIKR